MLAEVPSKSVPQLPFRLATRCFTASRRFINSNMQQYMNRSRLCCSERSHREQANQTVFYMHLLELYSERARHGPNVKSARKVAICSILANVQFKYSHL